MANTYTKYISMVEAVATAVQNGNNCLIPFDLLMSLPKAFDTNLTSFKGFEVVLEDEEYKSIRIDFVK